MELLESNFDHHISSLMEKEKKFIYKSNLELLKKFYDFIYLRFKNIDLCNQYLKLFTSIDDIKQDTIETNFSFLMFDQKDDYFNLELFNQFEGKSGIYFIYKQNGTLIYIGKSKHLISRPLESFMNKMIYGAYCMKIITLKEEFIDFCEAICIDYFLPMYNNKFETFDCSCRSYCKWIERIQNELYYSEILNPICNEEIAEFSVFDIQN